MEETIIIYTKYFSEAVIEILDKYDLNIQILCFSSYDKVLQYTKTTPNLRGIIFLEHKPRRATFKAYKEILTTADEIAESSKQPFCVSIISNTELPAKFITKINTSYIEILFTKFTMFNTDLLRFEGLSVVIMNTIGVVNDTILLELDKENSSIKTGTNSSKVEFLKCCLQIVIMPLNDLVLLEDSITRFPQLDKLVYLRNHSDMDNSILSSSESLFNVFAKQCIKRREEDEKKNSVIY